MNDWRYSRLKEQEPETQYLYVKFRMERFFVIINSIVNLQAKSHRLSENVCFLLFHRLNYFSFISTNVLIKKNVLLQKRILLSFTQFFHCPIHRIICKRFFFILHATNRSGNNPHYNSDNKDHNIPEFYVITTYRHLIDIEWNNSYRILQLIDSCRHLILRLNVLPVLISIVRWFWL